MANCIIHPIPLFQHSVNKSRTTYLSLEFEQLNTVNYVWYIEGTVRKVLVDAGGNIDYMTNVRGVPSEEIQTLDSGLSKLGLSFDDIDLIILTHLHHDHVAQARRFPKARFLVQKDELEFAQNPHPLCAGLYNREFFDRLNLEVIDGDAKISGGVSVIKTPGHTPGGQSICIKTGQGVAIVSGLCTIRENFEPPASLNITMPVIAPALHTNLFDAYDSVLRIKETADIIVTLHDPEYLQKSSIP